VRCLLKLILSAGLLQRFKKPLQFSFKALGQHCGLRLTGRWFLPHTSATSAFLCQVDYFRVARHPPGISELDMAFTCA